MSYVLNLTPDQVHERVAAIDTNDDEVAHGTEDTIWCNVLQAIAEGHPQARELAQAALATQELKFSRWYS